MAANLPNRSHHSFTSSCMQLCHSCPSSFSLLSPAPLPKSKRIPSTLIFQKRCRSLFHRERIIHLLPCPATLRSSFSLSRMSLCHNDLYLSPYGFSIGIISHLLLFPPMSSQFSFNILSTALNSTLAMIFHHFLHPCTQCFDGRRQMDIIITVPFR